MVKNTHLTSTVNPHNLLIYKETRKHIGTTNQFLYPHMFTGLCNLYGQPSKSGKTEHYAVTRLCKKPSPDLTDKSMTIQIDWTKGTKGACSTCNALCSVYDHREHTHMATLIRCNSRRAWSLRFRVFIVKSMESKA